MNTGFEFSDIYDEVVARAGGEQSMAEDVIKIRRSQRIVLQRWMNKGYNTWRIETCTVWPNGVSSYLTLPVEVDDVVEVVRGESGTLERITADKYMRISNKNQIGTPGQFWLDRKEPPRLYVNPVGTSTTSESLTVWYVRTPEEFSPDKNNSDDVPGRWLEALICGMAHDFARKRPPYDEALIARLGAESAVAEEEALRADRDRSRFRYRI